MKTPKWMGAPGCALLLASGTLLFAQGPLTPPGPPAPTMKSLDQLEPRTPISSIPFTISTPGSYFLTRNLTLPAADTGANGITITTDNVTIDLSGFTLDGAGIGGSGITAGTTSHHTIHIRNGNLQNWPSNGVYLWSCTSTLIENVQAQNNAVGIYVANGEISRCIANSNSQIGIRANFCDLTHCGASQNPKGFVLAYSTLRDSRADNCTDRGIDASYSTVEGCSLIANFWGIVAGFSNINHNAITSSSSDGIRADGSEVTIADNQISASGFSSNGSGVWVQTNGNRIINNNITGGTADGIAVAGAYNIIDSNSCIENFGFGINITGANNVIVHNSVLAQAGGTYSIVPGNNVGFAEPAPTSTHTWSNLQVP